ncbi:interleukin-22 isoform X2 [Nerophis lumbriciformis]
MMLIGWAQRTEAGPVPRPLSKPLRSPHTYQAAQEVSLHAQSLETPDETSIRLNPDFSSKRDDVPLCCLHAYILDFYLRNIFTPRDNQHPKLHQLHADLAHVSQDLQAHHGCIVKHYEDHQPAVEFRNKLAMMDNERGINKALGEVEMLFSNLQDSCVSTQ